MNTDQIRELGLYATKCERNQKIGIERTVKSLKYSNVTARDVYPVTSRSRFNARKKGAADYNNRSAVRRSAERVPHHAWTRRRENGRKSTARRGEDGHASWRRALAKLAGTSFWRELVVSPGKPRGQRGKRRSTRRASSQRRQVKKIIMHNPGKSIVNSDKSVNTKMAAFH